MKNLGEMLKQVEQMQARLADMRASLGDLRIEGRAGGGMVAVTLDGTGQMRSLTIDPALASGDEVEVLEDLIVAAHNDARAKLETAVAERMKEVTGGMALPPGLGLPF